MSVRAWYEAKTQALLAKYGPGPRVHFHVGFADASQADCDDPAELRRRLVAAQEAVLEESGRALAEAAGGDLGRMLDVGCGLGGGALFFARHHGASVTALTHVPEHARLVREFAGRDGLGGRVQPLVADAHAIPTRAVFDTAIAVESGCYFDHPVWLAALGRALRPGAHLLVVDGFLGDPRVKGEFDGYWQTDLASPDAMLEAASAAGFRLEKRERLNPRAIGFWELSRAWTRCRLRDAKAAAERERLERSLAAHARFQAMYASGAVEYQRLVLRRAGASRSGHGDGDGASARRTTSAGAKPPGSSPSRR